MVNAVIESLLRNRCALAVKIVPLAIHGHISICMGYRALIGRQKANPIGIKRNRMSLSPIGIIKNEGGS